MQLSPKVDDGGTNFKNASGRFKSLADTALNYAFILDLAGIKK